MLNGILGPELSTHRRACNIEALNPALQGIFDPRRPCGIALASASCFMAAVQNLPTIVSCPATLAPATVPRRLPHVKAMHKLLGLFYASLTVA
jgi:hypothetical protein